MKTHLNNNKENTLDYLNHLKSNKDNILPNKSSIYYGLLNLVSLKKDYIKNQNRKSQYLRDYMSAKENFSSKKIIHYGGGITFLLLLFSLIMMKPPHPLISIIILFIVFALYLVDCSRKSNNVERMQKFLSQHKLAENSMHITREDFFVQAASIISKDKTGNLRNILIDEYKTEFPLLNLKIKEIIETNIPYHMTIVPNIKESSNIENLDFSFDKQIKELIDDIFQQHESTILLKEILDSHQHIQEKTNENIEDFSFFKEIEKKKSKDSGDYNFFKDLFK